jgi:hypothetical protein
LETPNPRIKSKLAAELAVEKYNPPPTSHSHSFTPTFHHYNKISLLSPHKMSGENTHLSVDLLLDSVPKSKNVAFVLHGINDVKFEEKKVLTVNDLSPNE